MKIIQSILNFLCKSETISNGERIFDTFMSNLTLLTFAKVFGIINISWMFIIIPVVVIIIMLITFAISIIWISDQVFKNEDPD